MQSVIEEITDINDARVYAESIVETIREPLIVLNGNLKVVSANKSFYRKFEVSEEGTVGKYIYEVGNGQWNIPKLKEFLETIIPGNTEFHDYEVEHEFPRIGRRIMLLNGKRVEQEGGRRSLILLGIEDVTERIQAQRALRVSEEKFRGFVQNINSIVIRFNREGEITFFNHFAEQIFGFSEQEVLGKPVVGAILPQKDEEGRDLHAMVRDIINHPEQYYFKQVEGRKKDGGKVWFQWSVKETRDEQGNVREILVDGNDVTGEMEYRRMLQEMRGLVESSPDIMARFDGTMHLVYANPLLMRLIKRPKDEVIGKTVWELGLPAENAAALEESMRKAGEKKERLETVIRFDDREYHLQVVSEDEKTKSFKVYAADITDRKKMEDALRRNEYELRSIVENTPDIYFRLNRQLQYVFVNSTYEKLTGLAKEQFIGKTNSQLGMARQMALFWQSATQKVLDSGKEHTVELEMTGFFGKRYYSARIIPEFEKSGLIETVLVVARDITDRKLAEEELASAKS